MAEDEYKKEVEKSVYRTGLLYVVRETSSDKRFILLIKRSGQGKRAGLWEGPGGIPETDEDKPVAVLREF